MTDFAPLHYQRSGNGQPLVLIHGYLGGSDMWHDQLAFFKNHYDVIAFDLPGFGHSASLKAHDSIAAISAHILHCLTEMGVDRFFLLGHSMGGMIVQQMALDAPSRVEKLVCYGTGPVGVLPGRFEPIETSRQRIRDEGLTDTASRIAATWFVDGEAATGFPLCKKIGQMATVEAGLNSLTAWENWNVKNRLSEIVRPTLIIWGELDRSYDISQPEALEAGIQNSIFIKVPECAHNVHMENPDVFHQEVANFLSDKT